MPAIDYAIICCRLAIDYTIATLDSFIILAIRLYLYYGWYVIAIAIAITLLLLLPF